MRKVRTTIYLDEDLKREAALILRKSGLSLSTAVNMFLAWVVSTGRLPPALTESEIKLEKLIRSFMRNPSEM